MSKAAELAALIGSQSALSNRNLIINGAMQVAQRGTSSTTTSINTYATIDRFRLVTANPFDELALTQEQSTDAATGFATSYKLTVSTPETTLDANELLKFEQRIEGQNLQHLKKGTSDAESVTLSFWVKGSITGTYTINIFDKDNTRTIAKSYTIDSANIWEYKTVTFAGDTTGALDNDNAESLTVAWNLAAGTDRTSGTLATSWESNTVANLAVGQTDIVTTSGATWQITGVQLEVGETATPFEHRSYGDELARCQRYYAKTYNDGVVPGTATGAGAVFHSLDAQQDYAKATWDFPVTMRSNPTIVLYNDNNGTSGQVSGDSNNYTGDPGYIGNNRAIGGVSGVTLGGSSYLRFHATMDAEL